jgi:iron complex transport system substrate-binding protein
MIELAGGVDLLGLAGEPSQAFEWNAAAATKPDIIIIAPCGYDLARAKSELPRLQSRPGWEELPAVRTGKVFFMDANATLSRPGPRIVDGLEDLAQIIQPDLFRCLIEARRWASI